MSKATVDTWGPDERPLRYPLPEKPTAEDYKRQREHDDRIAALRAEQEALAKQEETEWATVLDGAGLAAVAHTTDEGTRNNLALRAKTALVLAAQRRFFEGDWEDVALTRYARAIGLSDDAQRNVRVYLKDTFGAEFEATVYVAIAKFFPRLAAHDLFGVQPVRKSGDKIIYFGQVEASEPSVSEIVSAHIPMKSRVAPLRVRGIRMYAAQTAAIEKLGELWNFDGQQMMVETSYDELGKDIDRQNVATALNLAAISGNVVSVGGSDWEEINIAFSLASNAIHKRSMRGPASYIVASAEIAACIEARAGDRFKPVKCEPTISMRLARVGTLCGRWHVYVDPYFPRAQALLGRAGASELDRPLLWGPSCFPVFPIKRSGHHGAAFAAHDYVALSTSGDFGLVDFLQLA